MLTATAVLAAAWALLALELTPNPTTGVTLAPHFSSAEAAATGDRLLATVAPTLDDLAPRLQPTGASTLTAPAPVSLVARPDLALSAGPVTATDLEPAEVALVARARARDNAPPFTEPMRGLSRPPTRVELAAQLVARARARDNAPPFTEPMRGLSRPPTRVELAAQLVARARARDNAPPFTEPMRGLSRPPTRAELSAQLVARARARDNAPPIVEPGYVIEASVIQTPFLGPGDIVEATVSFYYCTPDGAEKLGDGGGFCGVMRDGSVVYDGAAACAWAYLGQRFVILDDPSGQVYTCADTGSAVHGLHRDVWVESAKSGWSWQLIVGQTSLLRIVE